MRRGYATIDPALRLCACTQSSVAHPARPPQRTCPAKQNNGRPCRTPTASCRLGRSATPFCRCSLGCCDLQASLRGRHPAALVSRSCPMSGKPEVFQPGGLVLLGRLGRLVVYIVGRLLPRREYRAPVPWSCRSMSPSSFCWTAPASPVQESCPRVNSPPIYDCLGDVAPGSTPIFRSRCRWVAR